MVIAVYELSCDNGGKRCSQLVLVGGNINDGNWYLRIVLFMLFFLIHDFLPLMFLHYLLVLLN